MSRDWEEGHKMKDSTPSYDSKHRSGRRGRIIQDIAAPPHLCMQKILDYDNYSKMVSLLKTFEIYDHIRFSNVRNLLSNDVIYLSMNNIAVWIDVIWIRTQHSPF